MIADSEKQKLALSLIQAQDGRQAIDPLTNIYPHLTQKDAYAIQLELLRWQQRRGNSAVGKKVGFTDINVQKKLGLIEPGYGHLFDSAEIPDGGRVEIDGLFQPRVEGEVAFVLARELHGPHVTAREVLEATNHLIPAIEIIDSRMSVWMRSAADIISDNALSCLFIKGKQAIRVGEVDLSSEEMVLERNGEVARTGTGKAVLGNPASSVAWLANKLSESGDYLRAGELILSGSLCAPLAVTKGDIIRVNFINLGSASVYFV